LRFVEVTAVNEWSTLFGTQCILYMYVCVSLRLLFGMFSCCCYNYKCSSILRWLEEWGGW